MGFVELKTDNGRRKPSQLAPSTRTLFIAKFNDEYVIEPEPVEHLKTLGDVFEYYRPEVTIAVVDSFELPVIETFTFKTLADFSPDGLVKQSKTLRQLQAAEIGTATINFEEAIHSVLKEAAEFEQAYRAAALFFINANPINQSVRNVVFMNAAIDQLDPSDPINGSTIWSIGDEIRQRYDRFDLRDGYAFIVIPGYLGNSRAVDCWAKIAHDHRTLLVTDYADELTAKKIRNRFCRETFVADLTDPRYAHVVMTCNYLLGREPYLAFGETEGLSVPVSAALAGVMYGNPINSNIDKIQLINSACAGSTQFIMTDYELNELSSLPLLPARIDADNIVISSMTTLYTGGELALQKYSTVRLFDWIVRGILYLLDDRALENWNNQVQEELIVSITDFLDSLNGDSKPLRAHSTLHFHANDFQQDRLQVDVVLTPHLPNADFLFSFLSKPGLDGNINGWIGGHSHWQF